METSTPTILIVEDDENDQTFIRRAFKLNGVVNPIVAVSDGEEAMAYLRRVGPYTDNAHPLPRLIITDLKMPRMGGIELLDWLDKHEEFRLIPSIVLTSSNDQADIARAFRHGAKGYMIKPVQFGELQKLMGIIADYWRASCVPLPIRATG